jgi:hypothetical protein
MKLCVWRSSGMSLVLYLAVGCGGTQSGDLPRAPASSGDSAPVTQEKKVGEVKTMAPADAAEKYK